MMKYVVLNIQYIFDSVRCYLTDMFLSCPICKYNGYKGQYSFED